VFMDGWYPTVLIGGRRERVPVLVTLGARANGDRVVLDMRLVGEESAASRTDAGASLTARHLRRPVLAVIDANPGFRAQRAHWPGIAIRRCVCRKLRNLQAKALARLCEELTENYRRMMYGETVAAVEQARARFTKKWRLRCPAVVESLEEASDELFAFLRFPVSHWKALRTTDAVERISEEFRRRTKTQASLPGKVPCCYCCSVYSAADRSNCDRSMAPRFEGDEESSVGLINGRRVMTNYFSTTLQTPPAAHSSERTQRARAYGRRSAQDLSRFFRPATTVGARSLGSGKPCLQHRLRN
jgi:transposase-like protein